jgi:hypothetical protein
MKPYYYVFKTSGQPPNKRHKTIKSARLESLRRASLHPGQSFEILMCLGITQTSKASTFWINGMETCDNEFQS